MGKDILLKDGDLDIAGGDLVWDESAAQHVEHLLLAQKGDYKQSPLTGVGIADYVKSPLTAIKRAGLERQIRIQMEADGASGVDVSVNPQGAVHIKSAHYP